MTTSNNRPKVDLPHNGASIRLKLLKPKPIEGTNNYGNYYLYTVEQNEDTIERVFFAPQDVHEKIQEFNLKTGDQFLLKKAQNGKRNSYQIVLEANGKSPNGDTDNFKAIMQQSLQDAIEITKAVNTIPFQNEDIRAISSCLFIARTRLN
jgi:hypothetical protein